MKELIDLFEPLDEGARRDLLTAYAESLAPPAADLEWDIAEVRHDPECSDVVGIYLKTDPSGEIVTELAASVGPGVRTMTRALLEIICQGYRGTRRDTLAQLTAEDLAPVIGSELATLRAGTVDYVTRRFREAAAH